VAGDYAWEQAAQRFGAKDTIDDFQKKKYGWRTELLRRIQKWVVGHADLVITPSKYFQKLVSGWIKNPAKVHCIYNGISLVMPAKAGIQPTGSQIKFGMTKKTILSVGRLVPWKGFDKLIELMKDLPDWKLVIVGDGPEREALSVKCQASGVMDRVKLVGAVSREKLLGYLHSAGIFALNTGFESFSFQVVEAMNAGVPVITTRIGSLPELVEDGEEGILVEPDNKEQILAAINKIESDADFRKKIIENAKKKAQQFSISRTVDNLVKLINDASK
jgi:glycosyltransferase involved in cell wall biosynthesis